LLYFIGAVNLRCTARYRSQERFSVCGQNTQVYTEQRDTHTHTHTHKVKYRHRQRWQNWTESSSTYGNRRYYYWCGQ